MKVFKDEPVMNSNGFFVYPPAPAAEKQGNSEQTAYTYNGVILPSLPWEHMY